MPRSDPSYTEAHPVAVTLVCESCKITVAGNDIRPGMVEMFHDRHDDCEAEQ